MSRISEEQASLEFDKVLKFFKDELTKLRSGRANPDLLSNIKVEAYSQTMPLNQLANINVADATMLVVQPWDKSIVEDIRKAIIKSDLGISPVVDGEIIRLPLPPLTEERRQEYVKVLKQKAEEARISIRQIRKDVLVGVEQDEEAGKISEDDLERSKKELQEKVDKANEQVEAIAAEKEKELMQV